MNTAPYSAADEREEWDEPEEEPLALPSRPRRRVNGLALGGVFALLVGAIGFYVGIRVEKGQVTSSASSGSALSSRLAALGSRTGAAGGTGAGGAGAGLARFAGGGANATVGTISAVNGKTLYVTDFSGNTVKVTLSSATSVTKNQAVSTKAVRPGDTVIVSGLKASNGTISATTVSDSGNRGGSTGSSGSSSSGGSTSASSAVSSLFGSGG